ncbi:MAG: hypothetical protein ACTSQF_13330 [Candidatus Heimdallarchaeaceae archaeon]
MAQNPKSIPFFITQKRVFLSLLIIVLFFGFSLTKISIHSSGFEELQTTSFDVGAIPIAEITVPIDVVFAGYNEDYIDLTMMNNGLRTSVYYLGVDYIWNEDNQEYDSLLDLDVNLEFNFHFTSESYETALNSFIDTNSWNSNTSALNATQLNLQESTGERKSIFYEQEGRAIDGEAVEQYLDSNRGFVSAEPSYSIYFLNQSRFDTSDHSFEHWFEIDEVDPDSNATTDWWRLEWDNDLNPDVEFPYPCWGYQNRIFFADPYCHQWYTKWTDIWWNPDVAEGEFDYINVDLDTYLAGDTPGTPDFITHLNTYLIDYLNDIVSDVGGRGDGLLYNQRDVSSQVLFINDEAAHGYSEEDLQWIYHEEIMEDAFEYVVPQEVANITFDDTWVELSESTDLEQIVNDNKLGVAELGSYPWYRADWTYLDGVSIFYGFEAIRDSYFNTSKGDTTFTSWILLLQNVSMVAWAYGEYREFTGLGGSGNVVCYKDLNRYYATDGITPRSGVTTLLVHELGHVLGFAHAEITNDAVEGTGGFMRDVMSYYSEGTAYFSVFLKDSLYRTSSQVVYYRNKPAIDAYRVNPLHNITILAKIDEIIIAGASALESMNYLEAFLAFRQLYELTTNLEEITPTATSPTGINLSVIVLLLPIGTFFILRKKRRIRRN